MIRVFCDFDGTITKRDVGDALFERFGGSICANIIKDYRDEKISAVECYRRESEACGEVHREELHRFLTEQEIDKSFQEFVVFCQEQQFVLTIVSDGMEYYIRKILEQHHLDVLYFANTLELLPIEGSSKVRLLLSFPYTNEVCDRCACCKRNLLLTQSADDDITVYIGEGYSDRCPARYADMIFAKDELLQYCQQQHIPYYQYRTFHDISEQLKKFVRGADGRHRFRKRRQAELARREAFIAE
jgi:2,3-diketo-5-methylthio-1-phosphopentane phosphatase